MVARWESQCLRLTPPSCVVCAVGLSLICGFVLAVTGLTLSMHGRTFSPKERNMLEGMQLFVCVTGMSIGVGGCLGTYLQLCGIACCPDAPSAPMDDNRAAAVLVSGSRYLSPTITPLDVVVSVER